jgi:large subunit ribosomal protein L24
MSSSSKAASATVGPFKMFVRRSLLKKVNNEHLQQINSWHIVRGDTVFVRSGRSAGHIGRVLDVLRTKNRIVVEGANMVKRHVRAEGNQPGGVISTPSAIHYSNINLLDLTLKRPTKVAIRFTQGGEKTRVSKKSGAVIPWPEPANKYERPLRAAEPGPRDTPVSVVAATSYLPSEGLKPYLTRSLSVDGEASGVSVFENTQDPSFRVQKLLRRVPLRKKNRNEMRRRFDVLTEKAKLSMDVNAVVINVLIKVAERSTFEGASRSDNTTHSDKTQLSKIPAEHQLR